jgi:hypothetical protein
MFSSLLFQVYVVNYFDDHGGYKYLKCEIGAPKTR